MNNYEEMWKKTKPAEYVKQEGFDPIPDGTYSAYVEKVVFKETTEPHSYTIYWKITGPTSKGRLAFAGYKMNEKGMARLMRDIADMGLIVTEYKYLSNEIQHLVGKTATIKLETSEWQGKDFQNVWYEPKATTKAKSAPKTATATLFDENEPAPF